MTAAARHPVLYFEDIEIDKAVDTPARTVTEADLVRFATISGDHRGLDRTAGGPVPNDLVMLLTAGLGFRLPVPQPQVLAFMVFDWEFRGPVQIGDTLHCRMRVSAKRALKEGGVIVEKREVMNQRGEVVQQGEYKLLVARRPRA